MNTPYTIAQLLSASDFKDRMFKTEANVQKLMLGPIQSKKYFESVAKLCQNKEDKLAWVTLSKYHRAAGSRI